MEIVSSWKNNKNDDNKTTGLQFISREMTPLKKKGSLTVHDFQDQACLWATSLPTPSLKLALTLT